MPAQIHIGTSGWHYRHWLGRFYPKKLPLKRMGEAYMEVFDTVELNNSFYHLPKRETFEGWKKQSPKDFIFAVKVNRFITHNKKLKDADETLDYFLEATAGLGKKRGPLLFQLPPHWKVNTERLEELLKTLPKKLQCTFEFREPSWLNDEVYDILRKHNAAMCIYELAGFETEHIITADWSYIRLHGPGGKYQGSYSDKKLQEWADEIIRWKRKLTDIYVYFDNDENAYAVYNALTLREMLGVKPPPKPSEGSLFNLEEE